MHPLDDHDHWPAPYAGMLAIVLLALAIVALLVTMLVR